MSALLVAAGVVTVLGAAVAVGSANPRSAVLGLLSATVFAPFVADPLPGLPVLAFRVVAAVLAGYLLLVAARRAGSPEPGIGLPAALVAASAAFVAGLGATAVSLPTFGPGAALGAGLASFAVAIGPIARSLDPFRLGTSLLVIANGGLMLHAGLVGTSTPFESLLAGGTLVLIAAAASILVATAATAAGHGGPEPGAAVRRRPTGTGPRR